MQVTTPPATTAGAASSASTAQTAAAQGGTAATTGSGTTGSGAPGISADFTTFLKMLTTQMQNQDPMDPMKSSDFAVQLATFSGVEQQVKTNTLLQSLAGQLGGQGMAQVAGWIGMEARTTAPVQFSGKPITLVPAPQTGADRAVLVVKNASGIEVARSDISASGGTMDWAGTGTNGKTLPNGTYSFSVESYQSGALMGTDPVPAYAKVTEAQTGANGPVLVLDGGTKVNVSDVSALRSAT